MEGDDGEVLWEDDAEVYISRGKNCGKWQPIRCYVYINSVELVYKKKTRTFAKQQLSAINAGEKKGKTHVLELQYGRKTLFSSSLSSVLIAFADQERLDSIMLTMDQIVRY
jgi:hypothetical protein